MELKQLNCFQTCAELRSFTKAAEALYTSQPHVSMIIRSLEKELGLKLFYRKSKGIELTESGKIIYDYSRNILKNAALITATAQAGRFPELKIATNPSSNMSSLVTDYYKHQKSDALHLRYTECGLERMMPLIADKQIDLGFAFISDNKRRALYHLLKQKRLHFESLLQTDAVLHVGPNHPLYGEKSILPQALNDLSFIQLQDDYFTLNDFIETLEHPHHPLINRAVITNSDHAMVRFLKETQLVNLGSYWLKESYRQHNFGCILIKGFEKKIDFGFIAREDEKLPPVTAKFLSYVQETVARENPAPSE